MARMGATTKKSTGGGSAKSMGKPKTKATSKKQSPVVKGNKTNMKTVGPKY